VQLEHCTVSFQRQHVQHNLVYDVWRASLTWARLPAGAIRSPPGGQRLPR
jgi:hypothetical protein